MQFHHLFFMGFVLSRTGINWLFHYFTVTFKIRISPREKISIQSDVPFRLTSLKKNTPMQHCETEKVHVCVCVCAWEGSKVVVSSTSRMDSHLADRLQ